MNDPTYIINREKIIMDAYEGILFTLRQREREILNVKRFAEHILYTSLEVE